MIEVNVDEDSGNDSRETSAPNVPGGKKILKIVIPKRVIQAQSSHKLMERIGYYYRSDPREPSYYDWPLSKIQSVFGPLCNKKFLTVKDCPLLSEFTPPSVQFGKLISQVINARFNELEILFEVMPRQSNADKKRNLLHFLKISRIMVAALLALRRFMEQNANMHTWMKMIMSCNELDAEYIGIERALCEMDIRTLKDARAPQWDVSLALLLLGGSNNKYRNLLPEKVFECVQLSSEQENALRMELDRAIRHNLVLVGLSSLASLGWKIISIERGMLRLSLLSQDKEVLFTVLMTLKGNGQWRILSIEDVIDTFPASQNVHSKQSLLHFFFCIIARVKSNESLFSDLKFSLESWRLYRRLFLDFIGPGQQFISKNIVPGVRLSLIEKGFQLLIFAKWKVEISFCRNELNIIADFVSEHAKNAIMKLILGVSRLPSDFLVLIDLLKGQIAEAVLNNKECEDLDVVMNDIDSSQNLNTEARPLSLINALTGNIILDDGREASSVAGYQARLAFDSWKVFVTKLVESRKFAKLPIFSLSVVKKHMDVTTISDDLNTTEAVIWFLNERDFAYSFGDEERLVWLIVSKRNLQTSCIGVDRYSGFVEHQSDIYLPTHMVAWIDINRAVIMTSLADTSKMTFDNFCFNYELLDDGASIKLSQSSASHPCLWKELVIFISFSSLSLSLASCELSVPESTTLIQNKLRDRIRQCRYSPTFISEVPSLMGDFYLSYNFFVQSQAILQKVSGSLWKIEWNEQEITCVFKDEWRFRLAFSSSTARVSCDTLNSRPSSQLCWLLSCYFSYVLRQHSSIMNMQSHQCMILMLDQLLGILSPLLASFQLSISISPLSTLLVKLLYVPLQMGLILSLLPDVHQVAILDGSMMDPVTFENAIIMWDSLLQRIKASQKLLPRLHLAGETMFFSVEDYSIEKFEKLFGLIAGHFDSIAKQADG